MLCFNTESIPLSNSDTYEDGNGGHLHKVQLGDWESLRGRRWETDVAPSLILVDDFDSSMDIYQGSFRNIGESATALSLSLC